MSTISFDDLITNPSQPSVEVEPTMDVSDWDISFVDVYEEKKSGFSFINVEEKKIVSYIVQGYKLNSTSLNTSRLAKLIEETKIPIIKTAISNLYSYEFDPEAQITCKYFAGNIKAGNTIIEPLNFPFEWPNETRMNVCTKLSNKSVPAGCGCVNAQFECKIGFKDDTREFYSYHDKDNKVFVRVGIQRYGFGNPLNIVHVGNTDDSANAFSHFGPVEKPLSILTDHVSDPGNFNSMNYFGEDYESVFNKYLSSLLDDLFDQYGELIKEVNPTKEIQKEYFDYVKSI